MKPPKRLFKNRPRWEDKPNPSLLLIPRDRNLWTIVGQNNEPMYFELLNDPNDVKYVPVFLSMSDAGQFLGTFRNWPPRCRESKKRIEGVPGTKDELRLYLLNLQTKGLTAAISPELSPDGRVSVTTIDESFYED